MVQQIGSIWFLALRQSCNYHGIWLLVDLADASFDKLVCVAHQKVQR